MSKTDGIKTMHTYRGYAFTIRYEPKDPAFTVHFPDIRETITSGRTLAGAFKNACEALDLHLETLQKLDRPLPKPHHRLVMKSA